MFFKNYNEFSIQMIEIFNFPGQSLFNTSSHTIGEIL